MVDSSGLDFLFTKECTICIVAIYIFFLLAKSAAGRAFNSWRKCQKSKAARIKAEKDAAAELGTPLATDEDTGLQKVD